MPIPHRFEFVQNIQKSGMVRGVISRYFHGFVTITLFSCDGGFHILVSVDLILKMFCGLMIPRVDIVFCF